MKEASNESEPCVCERGSVERILALYVKEGVSNESWPYV